MALASVIGNETLCSWPRGGGWLGDADGWLEGRPCLTAGGADRAASWGKRALRRARRKMVREKKTCFAQKLNISKNIQCFVQRPAAWIT